VENINTLPSDRKFGFLFSAVFAIVAADLYWHQRAGYIVFTGLSALTLIVALSRPRLLHGANRIWMAFGLLLSKIVSPVVLGILFLVVFMPIGLVMRLFGRDALKLKPRSEAQSYWIMRDPAGPAPDSLREQG
jgi:type IV secretory pathway VirB3-like protein